MLPISKQEYEEADRLVDKIKLGLTAGMPKDHFISGCLQISKEIYKSYSNGLDDSNKELCLACIQAIEDVLNEKTTRNQCRITTKKLEAKNTLSRSNVVKCIMSAGHCASSTTIASIADYTADTFLYALSMQPSIEKCSDIIEKHISWPLVLIIQIAVAIDGNKEDHTETVDMLCALSKEQKISLLEYAETILGLDGLFDNFEFLIKDFISKIS